MRTIKFRAFDADKKQMQSFELGNGGKLSGITRGLIVEQGEYGNPNLSDLMQFVGLTDKNGVEIFEGDIIEYRFEDKGAYSKAMKGEVTFRDGRFECPYSLGEIIIYKILGNIHENPELLK